MRTWAKERFQSLKFAESSRAGKSSRLRLWCELSHRCEQPSPLPLTEDKIDEIMGCLTESHYRSSTQYLTEAKTCHIDAGHAMGLQLQYAIHKARRAAMRGQPPPRRAGEIFLHELAGMAESGEQLVRTGPLYPKR